MEVIAYASLHDRRHFLQFLRRIAVILIMVDCEIYNHSDNHQQHDRGADNAH